MSFGDTFLQHADVIFEDAVHGGAHVSQFLVFRFHDRAVGGLFVGVEFENQGVVAGDKRHDVLVVEVDGGGNELVCLVSLVNVDQIAGLFALLF